MTYTTSHIALCSFFEKHILTHSPAQWQWRRADGHNVFNSSKCAMNRLIASKSTSNQIHFSPFLPDHDTKKAKWNIAERLQLNHELSRQLCLFLPLSRTTAFFAQEMRQKQTSFVNNQQSAHQEIIMFLKTGHVVIPLPSQRKRFTWTQKEYLAKSLDGPRSFMLFTICARGKASLQLSQWGASEKAEPGRWLGGYSAPYTKRDRQDRRSMKRGQK